MLHVRERQSAAVADLQLAIQLCISFLVDGLVLRPAIVGLRLSIRGSDHGFQRSNDKVVLLRSTSFRLVITIAVARRDRS